MGKTTSARPKSVRCNNCGKRIRIPQGWTVGPAVRRHYWRHHREVMRPHDGERS